MHEAILDRLTKRSSLANEHEESRLKLDTAKALSNIKRLQRGNRSRRNGRGGLSSMKARGTFVKQGDIYNRRVIVKAKFKTNNGNAFKEKLRKHLEYITRGGAGEDGVRPSLFSETNENLDPKKVYEKFSEAPHNFRFIISPEDGDKLDLKKFTKDLINVIEQDLGTKVEWAAAVHHDTNDPHVHMVINGRDKFGKDLFIKRDYITHGIRTRASKNVSNTLGLRSREDVVKSLELGIKKNKKSALDDAIISMAKHGEINLNQQDNSSLNDIPKELFSSRLVYLESIGLAKNIQNGSWQVNDDYVASLRNIDLSDRFNQKISSLLNIDKETCHIPKASDLAKNAIEGRVIKRGRIDEIDDDEYLVIKAKDDKYYYVELEKYSEKIPAEVGEMVRIDGTKPFSGPKTSDENIIKQADGNGGIYDARKHAKNSEENGKLPPGVSGSEYAQIHVKRLEVLARRGLVKELANGRFEIPKNYSESISLEAQKSERAYKAHIKVTRLAPAKERASKLSRGLNKPC